MAYSRAARRPGEETKRGVPGWVIGSLVTLAVIVILLYAHFRRVAETGIVMLGTIAFAPLGGIWLLYLFDFNLSVAVGVGFIALLGLAAEGRFGGDVAFVHTGGWPALFAPGGVPVR